MARETNNPGQGTGPNEGGGDSMGDARQAFGALLDSEPAVTRGGRRMPTEDDTNAPSGDPNTDPLVIDEETEGAERDAADDQHGHDQSQQDDDESDVLDGIPDDLKSLKFKVKIGDKFEALTLEEIQKGYLRQADYTQKTQATAQERNAVAQNLQALAFQRQQADQFLGTAYQLLQQQMPQEPNWAQLAQHQDPRVLIMARTEWEAHQAKLNQFAQAAIANRQAWQAEQQQLYQHRMASEFERLVQANPDFQDPAKRTAAKARFTDYALSRGFTADELKGVVDHRMLLVLDDAAKYREALARQAAKRGAVTPGNGQRPTPIRTATPGTQQARTTNQTRAAKTMQSHLKRGTVDTATAVFKDLL